MKEKVKLIQGDPDRAEEIRKTLKEWGAEDDGLFKFSNNEIYYYVGVFGYIGYVIKDIVNNLIGEGKAEIYNLPEPKHQFKPFDKVLVRNTDYCVWRCDIFSHMLDNGEYYCVSAYWNQCIPYEGNEDLIGTSYNPK